MMRAGVRRSNGAVYGDCIAQLWSAVLTSLPERFATRAQPIDLSRPT
jgi:hypothetical protein